MGKEKNKKSLLKIVAATSVAIFSLFSVCTGVLSWFYSVRETNDESEEFLVTNYEKLYKVSYHQFVGTPNDTNCSFNKTPVASITYNQETRKFDKPKNGSGQTIDSFTFSLDPYDPMNKHKPMLVLIELSEEFNSAVDSDISVLASTDTTDFIGAKNTNHLAKYQLGPSSELKVRTVNNTTYHPLTSAVTFRSMAFSNSEYNTWAGSTNYNVTLENTDEPDHDFVFVDPERDESSFYNQSLVYSSLAEDVVKYIAIVVDYNDSALEYIYSTFLGNPFLEENEYILHFACDWIWEIG